MTNFDVRELDKARAAMDAHNYEFARDVFDRAHRNGVREVALTLGWLAEQGLGGPQDLKQARSLYEAALAHDLRSARTTWARF